MPVPPDEGFPISREAYDQFIEDCCANMPEAYDGDEAVESIIVRYIRDLEAMPSPAPIPLGALAIEGLYPIRPEPPTR